MTPCPRCGVGPARVHGACAGCLLASAVDGDVPARIGDYDVLDVIDRGGMGAVFRARSRAVDRVVALKVILAGELASDAERARFRAEIDAAAALDHPGIVPIYEVGEHAGRAYYTMRLFAGALAAQLARFRAPVAAAALIATVAEAVHHGHVRGVLHRDLKPANILLDDDGRPYVGDFGTAKRLGRPGLTEPGVRVGTPAYMAPEQRRADAAVTTAVDIYSLGVVLHELVTGRLPDETDVRRVPGVPRDLETICLTCLAPDPAARYRSADELADDLRRFARGAPIAARPAGLVERVWRLTRRHWLIVGGMLGTIVLLAVVAATALVAARAQQGELVRDTLRANAYAAHALAGTVAFHLREQVDAVVAIADDPAVAAVLASGDAAVLERRRAGTPFDSIALFAPDGALIAHAPPPPPGRLGRSYAWRDYFIGAHRLGVAGHAGGYISRAFRSEADERTKFAVAAPVGHAGAVVMVTLGTDSALGRMRLDDGRDDGPTAMLIAPRDRARDEASGHDELVVILHDGLAHGDEVAIDSPPLRALRTTRAERDQLRAVDQQPSSDADHRDPVPGFPGRWLAGFAPVSETGFVVIVETRYDDAVASSARLSRRLGWRVSAAIVTWSLVFGAVVWGYARRRSGRRSGGWPSRGRRHA
jgi:serine/threonine-protein kinase